MTYTPTTEEIREGFAQDPITEYHDPLTNHAQYGREAFDRWYAEEIRQAKEEARNEAFAEAAREFGNYPSNSANARDNLRDLGFLTWLKTAPNPYKEQE